MSLLTKSSRSLFTGTFCSLNSCALRASSSKKVEQFEHRLNEDKSPNTPIGLLERKPKKDPNTATSEDLQRKQSQQVFAPFPDRTNPTTGEVNGPTGPEPTRYGDWERKGRCSDF